MILVTGGTGYIGSHACLALIQAGYRVMVLDNLSNSHSGVLDRLERICGTRPDFVRGDIRDVGLLRQLFSEYEINAVMHFAGLKSVGESVEKPLEYYDNNVRGTLDLLSAMREAKLKSLIFSSSATVYGDPASVPIKEDAPRSATNPYGRTKLMIEEILADYHHAEPDMNIMLLRYFNPIGAHESGLIGEDPQGIPNNLMPFITQVAIGRRDKLSIFGGDYPTCDGTGVRDYIHVMDLVEGHVAALRYCQDRGGLLTVNLGTGQGYSVLQMVRAFERASNKIIPYEIVSKRNGDIAQCWADPTAARELLGWQAQRSLEQMCVDSWRWQENNPKGYR